MSPHCVGLFYINQIGNTMKPIYFLLAFLFISSSLFAQLERIHLEVAEYNTCDGLIADSEYFEDLTTYRIYAELSSTDYSVFSFGGLEACSPMYIGSTQAIFNSPIGSAGLASQLNLSLCGITEFTEELGFGIDSWLTIGDPLNPELNIDYVAFNPNFDLVNFFGSNASPMEYYCTECDVYTASPASGAMDENSRVLLAQITTAGEIEYALNIRVKNNITEEVFHYIHGNCDFDDPSSLEYFEGVDGFFHLTGNSSNCNDETACNYNENVLPEEADPSTCDYSSCLGCTDPTSCDYSSLATIDDGTCGTTCEGCTNQLAENYDPEAIIDNGTCILAGCNYPLAENYNADASVNDGTCIVLGCTNPDICNFNPLATQDDGSCDGINCPGCTDANAVNYNPLALNDDGSCHAGPFQKIEQESAITENGYEIRYYAKMTTPNAKIQKVSAHGNCSQLRWTGGSMDNFFIDDYFAQSVIFNTDFLNIQDWSYFSIGDPDLGPRPQMYFYSDEIDNWNPLIQDGGFSLNSGEWGPLDMLAPQYLDADNRMLIARIFSDTPFASHEFSITVLDENNIPFTYVQQPCLDGDIIYAPNSNLLGTSFYCNDTEACNYLNLNEPEFVDNSLCEYSSCYYEVSGNVFEDLDGNGSISIGDDPISGVNIEMTNPTMSATTNELGEYSFGEINLYTYPNPIVSITPQVVYPTNSTPAVRTVNTMNSNNINFGVHNEDLFYSANINVALIPVADDIEVTCNGLLNIYSGTIQNTSNSPVSGVVRITFDDVFDNWIFTSNGIIDESQTVEIHFNNLYPSHLKYFSVGIGGPDIQYIGETVGLSAEVYFDETGNTLIASTTSSNEVTCGYDPNDKRVVPEGYGEPHYILDDTELNYFIRFQNTGNAPAINVTVVDTLDVNLDLSSLELSATSHYMEMSVDSLTRAISFHFPNIFLPDSTSNEPESHGFITFKVKAPAGLAPETRIENTAYIYFDNNPAIITNTTWNTIFNCATKSQLNLPSVLCKNETLELVLDDPFAETYEWNVWPQGTIDLLNESGSMVNWNAPEIGNYSIHMTATNPLCSTAYNEVIEVIPAPNATFASNENTLFIDNTEPGESYQWFLNGEAILNENDVFFQIAESGNYSVSINGENGCADLSDESFVLFTNVGEQTLAFKAFPNPCDEQLELRLNEAGTWNLRVLDALGRIVHSNTIQGNNYVLNTKALSNGTYTLVLHGNQEVQHLKFMVQH